MTVKQYTKNNPFWEPGGHNQRMRKRHDGEHDLNASRPTRHDSNDPLPPIGFVSQNRSTQQIGSPLPREERAVRGEGGQGVRVASFRKNRPPNQNASHTVWA